MVKFNSIIKKMILRIISKGLDGESIFNRKWDNLIILDACRYDVFAEAIKEFKVEGKLEYIISLGSDTTEFLQRNFTDTKYEDIVYVTANPFVNIILKGKVYKIIPVWDHGWDPELGTVPPQQVLYHTLKSYLKYPDKKFIVHFIQPHYPYISYIFRPMQDALEQLRRDALINTPRKDFALPLGLRRLIRVLYERKIYHAKFYVEIKENDHIRAYKNNLRWVLPYALKLANLLPGTNVITADHGEAFGERLHRFIPIKVYGHLPEIHIPVLVKVPWLVIENKSPKEVALRNIREEIRKLSTESIRSRISKVKERLKQESKSISSRVIYSIKD
jgi:hypothetical protein